MLELTPDVSQDETSEEFIGEWAEKRGIRDQLVITTKASPVSLELHAYKSDIPMFSLVLNEL